MNSATGLALRYTRKENRTLAWFLPLCLLLSSQKTAPPQTTPPLKSTTNKVVSLATDEGDIRLDKRFQLRSSERPLGEIIRTLSKTSGIRLLIADKWIADLSTTAYTHPMPLYVIMHRLADLHNLSWRVEQNNAPNNQNSAYEKYYCLYESLEDKKYIEYLKDLSWAPLRQKVAVWRNYAPLSPKQLKYMAERRDRLAAQMQEPFVRANVILSAMVSDAVLEELISKRNLTLPFNQLSPEAQDALAFIVNDIEGHRRETIERVKAEGYNVPDYKPNPCPLNHFRVRYTVQGTGYDAVLMMMLDYDGGAFGVRAPSEIGGEERGWIDDKFASARLTVATAYRVEARRVPKSLRLLNSKWSDALKTIADDWKLNVFSDAYPHIPHMDDLNVDFQQSIAAESPLQQGLNCCSLWNRVFWQEGHYGDDILFLRNDWYQYRDSGKTDRLIAPLMYQKKHNESFALEDIAGLAEIPAKQSAKVEALLGLDMDSLQQSGEVLRFYQKLSDSEKLKLIRYGLTFYDLTSAEQEDFVRILQSLNANVSELGIEKVRLRLAVEGSYSRFYFEATGDFALPLFFRKTWRIDGIPYIAMHTPKKEPQN